MLDVDAIARGEGDGLEAAAIARKTFFGIAGAGQIALQKGRQPRAHPPFGIGECRAQAHQAGIEGIVGRGVGHGCRECKRRKEDPDCHAAARQAIAKRAESH